ncbi:hypothetical protein [Methanoregula sp.]|uniref:hypothetical protein n=1 Tax=Methanoregula sp. TaxID=2052170 RepID=UPI003C72269E
MLFTILVFGLILIFFDFTLIQLLCMMIIIVIIMPFLLGLATIDEVRTKLVSVKKTGLLKRLDEMKFFEKSAPSSGQKTPRKEEKTVQKTGAKETKPKVPATTGGIRLHINAFMSSVGSLGTILSARAKQGKKVEDINKMLDKTVSEKVTKSALPAATGSTAASPPLGGAGPGTGGSATDTDPFLSLSNDEFDPGLLDGLDDEVASFPSPDGEGTTGGSGLPLPEPELSMPSPEDSAGLASLPADEGTSGDGGLDAFKGLDSGDTLDADFGDLENLSLDDVEPDDDMVGMGGTSAEPAAAHEDPAPSAPSPAAPPADSGVVKTAWVPSDAPKGADMSEDQVNVQSDMASFASASGGSDEDLLSSIASDVKTVKKEKDVSLLRELKDFKAPAGEIENELKDMFDRMSVVQKPKEKNQPPANGIK